MMTSTTDPRLIKANIALFNGSRAEARRLLSDFSAAVPQPPEDVLPMFLWLSAQAQDDREARQAALQTLLDKVNKNDRYARLAAQYLENEQKYAVDTKPASEGAVAGSQKRRIPKILGVELWKAAVMLGIGLVIGVFAFSIFGNPSRSASQTGSALTNATLASATATTNPAQLVSRATSIPPETHQVEYPQGRLQISAVEPNSVRVIDPNGVPRQPSVSGTQFYGVKLIFECLEGVCNRPPEADLLLQMSDGVLLPPVQGLQLSGENTMQGIAQGLDTNGWVVFEIPNTSIVTGLVALPPPPPEAPPGTQREPLLITLGSTLSGAAISSESTNLSVEVTPDDNASS